MSTNNDDEKKAELERIRELSKLLNKSNSLLSHDDMQTDHPIKNGYPVYNEDIRNTTIQKVLSNELSMKDAENYLEEFDWLTPDVVREIEQYYPKQEDIDTEAGVRNGESFKRNCEKLFPKDRVFTSKNQLSQMLDLFLKPWGAVKACTGTKFHCHYSPSTKVTSRKKHCDSDKTRHRESSKDNNQCKFHINIVMLNAPKLKRISKDFYQCRITTAVYEHSCELSPEFQRVAMKSTGKFLSFDKTKFGYVLDLVHRKPRIGTTEIRPYLEEVIPHYIGVTGQVVSNFLTRARKWLCVNGPPTNIRSVDVEELTSKKPTTAADETIDSDDDIILHNFTEMMKRIMSEDGNTWTALQLCEETKAKVPGFDYRIRRDSTGKPNGIIWITPENRKNLLRYGDILCLDMQLRQYNSSGWPYCGIALMDGDRKLRLGAQCIIIGEEDEAYAFMVLAIKDMENRFDLTNIKIIFADQKISENLLVRLGIDSTCVLHGDYYHLMKLVWPKTFSTDGYTKIHPHLKQMLRSSTREEYETAYNQGVSQLEGQAKNLGELERIFKRASYYGGYVLNGIDGNLGILGDSQAERNHASIVKYFGQGATWDLCEQIANLLKREQNQIRSRMSDVSNHFVQCHNYNSQLEPNQLQKYDTLAKRVLTSYAYNELFMKALKRMLELQKTTDSHGNIEIWSIGVRKEDAMKIKVIEKGARCGCYYRRTYLIQCSHELLAKEEFIIEDWSTRWYNVWTYDKKFEDHCHFKVSDSTYVIAKPIILNNNNHQSSTSEEVSTFATAENENGADYSSTISNRENPTVVDYPMLAAKMSELQRCISNDKTEQAKWYMIIQQSIERYRNEEQVFLKFDQNQQEKQNADVYNTPQKATT